MIVGIVGLGLIGGSFAKAYSAAGHKVYALDIDEATFKYALVSGCICGELCEEVMKEADLILICTYPDAAIEFMKKYGPVIGKKPLVMDCCGTKRVLFDEGISIASKYGFTYVGAHPMAGTQYSGFKYAKENLFKNAPMVIVPPRFDDIVFLNKIKTMLSPAGFSKISVTTADKHDEMIAFTSQLAHVVSSAYIKSPTASSHKGFSAGSYKDMTRVAWLNSEMWTELFFDNKDYLEKEIDILLKNIEEYRAALHNNDKEAMKRLLEEGKKRKEEVDG